MFTGAKMIVKPEGQVADEFEQSVAQELFNLQVWCYTELLVLPSVTIYASMYIVHSSIVTMMPL
jgi:hypothetical protein